MPSLRILGPLLLQGSDGEVRIGGDKPRRLLAALALYAGDTVSVDRLIDIIWDTRPPRSARENVQTYLWSLRRSLQASGPSIRIQVQAPGYLLQADPEELDWHCFTTMTSAARQCLGADPANAGKLLREALELWRGRFWPISPTGSRRCGPGSMLLKRHGWKRWSCASSLRYSPLIGS